MAKTKKKPSAKRAQNNMDGVYLLKLTLYVILGSMWIKITHNNTLNIPIPVGFIAGLLFASHEHFQIDRKIEYAVLMVAMLVGYFAPYGLYLNF
jgi:hypothetical protein